TRRRDPPAPGVQADRPDRRARHSTVPATRSYHALTARNGLLAGHSGGLRLLLARAARRGCTDRQGPTASPLRRSRRRCATLSSAVTEPAATVAALLHEAGETHHLVYRIVAGDDPDWASWYADWLLKLSELPQLLAATPVRSELVWTLVELDKAYTKESPDVP